MINPRPINSRRPSPNWVCVCVRARDCQCQHTRSCLISCLCVPLRWRWAQIPLYCSWKVTSSHKVSLFCDEKIKLARYSAYFFIHCNTVTHFEFSDSKFLISPYEVDASYEVNGMHQSCFQFCPVATYGFAALFLFFFNGFEKNYQSFESNIWWKMVRTVGSHVQEVTLEVNWKHKTCSRCV